MALVYGITVGWVSPSIKGLQSPDNYVLDRPITDAELSLVGSVMCLGGLVGSVVFGWAVNIVGRKRSLLILALPQVLSFLLIALAKNITYLYIARILGGFAGGGVLMIVPIYATEISEDA